MAIDLLQIQPTTISRDLRNKLLMIYSLPKVGKTSFAAECPNVLLFAFEKGYNAIAGIHALDITKWAELKIALKQLEKEEVKQKYEAIALDTVSIMWELCEKYICSKHNVETLADISWGKGYAECEKEFESVLRRISQLNYGMILITHSEVRVEKIDDTNSIEIVQPSLNKRASKICNALVDIIGYIQSEFNEDGSSKRVLYTRATPTLMAGSRFPHLPNKIPFGYSELTEALARAIELSGSKDGAVIVDKQTYQEVIKDRPFEEIQEEGKTLWSKLIEQDENNVSKIMDAVEKIFNERKKLSDITPKQKDLFELLILEMRAI